MSDDSTGNSKLVILGLFALAVVGAFAFLFLRKSGTTALPSAEPSALPVPNASALPAQVTRVRFLYGSEKKAWVVEALGRFAKAHPEIAVDTVEKGSLEMVTALLDQ